MSRRASYNYSSVDTVARFAAQAVRQVEYERRRAESERRRAEWAQRTSEITADHLARYQSVLDDIREQGLVEFVPAEFAEISELVQRARSLTQSDPASARDVSRQIGPRIGPLPRTARRLRAELRAAEVQVSPRATFDTREVAAKPSATETADKSAPQGPAAPVESPAEAAWRKALAGWTDILARDLAFGELAELRQQVGNPSGLSDSREVKSQVNALRIKWEAEAEKQRREEAELAELQQQLAEEPPTVEDAPPIEGEAPEPSDSGDPEESRRGAVRAVMGALEDAGFQVANPRLIDGEVVVVGTRPNGASATFNLTIDGSLEYDFSGYRGSNCDVDIDAVVPALQEVYGIQLTEEVVSWRNPDDEDATARPQPGRTRNA